MANELPDAETTEIVSMPLLLLTIMSKSDKYLLTWKSLGGTSIEAIIGDWDEGDALRFSISHYPFCNRRGPYRLLVEVAGRHESLWGCFDEQDQPMRWYHWPDCAVKEADALARVLLKGRMEHEKPVPDIEKLLFPME